MLFSIVVVCLDPGEKLKDTLQSILEQSCRDYEIILQDGGSKDGSIEAAREALADNGERRQLWESKVRIFREKDQGIYDAMNRAVTHVQGELVLFLNCGDLFYEADVLAHVQEKVNTLRASGLSLDKQVLYGDTYGRKQQVLIASPPKIDGFACYRNIPCHQSCFYGTKLCREKPYDLQYSIRADYDHFLWCYYRAEAEMHYLGFPVSSYEGDGFSESPENQKKDREQHGQITSEYMAAGELRKYRVLMALTLAPLRRFLAENKLFAGAYHWLKENIYTRKKWFLIAFCFFLLEMFFLAGPGGWLQEEEVSYLTGEGMWSLEGDYDENVVRQCFSPQYSKLKSIGVCISGGGYELSGGSMVIAVRDGQEEIVYEQTIPYEEMELEVYTDVEMNLELSSRRDYYLDLYLEPDAQGVQPMVQVCSMALALPENQRTVFGEEQADTQLVTRYIYADAVTNGRMLKALLLSAAAAFLIAFSMPNIPWLKRILGCAILLLLPPVLGVRLELLSIQAQHLLPTSMNWNMAIMYFLEVVLLLCTQSLRATALASNILLTILYSANYFVYEFRGTPLRINDLSAAGTAAEVVGGYSLAPNSHLAFAWAIALVFGILAWKAGQKKGETGRKKNKKSTGKLAVRVCCFVLGLVVAGAGGYQLLYTDFLEEHGLEAFHGFDEWMMYHCYGYLAASCLDIQNSRVEMPEGYTRERVEALLAEYLPEAAETSEEDMPHIIVVMNESLADLRVLGELELSQENLGFFNSLTENTVRGYTNVSVLGGGTANSEFELFTGCDMGLLPSAYYAYQQGMHRPVPSLVSTMEEQGYTTYSMHPESASNWNRNYVYEYFGFDVSLWKSDFEGAEVLHSGVSDLETYRKVEEIYENRQKGEKLFVFDLTMQNHGGYPEADDAEVRALNVNSPEADSYLSLIKESDEAFSQLISYFQQQEEKVIVCMFGDHQPKFGDVGFYNSIYAQTPGLSEEEKLFNQYRTPFVIWANYDIEEQQDLEISVNYLGTLLLQTAGLEGSAYFNYLAQLMEEYPVITVNGYRDSAGTLHEWSGSATEFEDYRMMQYHYLFDPELIEWGY